MPTARNRLVSLDETPYYHCISRCVRRAFLCGHDTVTGFNFEHRRQWIVDRIKLLCSVFAIDLYAYAVMSNHYHVVLCIDETVIKRWSEREIARRWTRLFSRPVLIQRYLSNATLSTAEQERVTTLLSTWRLRLADLSWFMRCLNEPIARLANQEDRCTGRFWQGRFTSQALLDERALLACMAYVDLNPIRAALARTPEASAFTSVQERIQRPHATDLKVFSDHGHAAAVPCTLKEYLELVDWAGRAIVAGKRGFMLAAEPPLFARLNLHAAPVLDYLRHTEAFMPVALGPVSQLRRFAHSLGRRFIKGLTMGKVLCPEPG